MSKRKWVAAKLFAVLGGTCLAIAVCVPRATAVTVPPFSAANYANRYVCNLSDDSAGTTAVARVSPNGAGAYNSGDLEVALDGAVFAFDPAVPPEDNFCAYTLNPASSSYTVGANGLGTEVQRWKAVPGNNADCPGSFVLANEIALRTNVNAAGKVQNVQLTSGNLADDGEPGYGSCLK